MPRSIPETRPIETVKILSRTREDSRSLLSSLLRRSSRAKYSFILISISLRHLSLSAVRVGTVTRLHSNALRSFSEGTRIPVHGEISSTLSSVENRHSSELAVELSSKIRSRHIADGFLILLNLFHFCVERFLGPLKF